MNLEQSIPDKKFNVHQPHDFFFPLLIMSINYANLSKKPTEYLVEGEVLKSILISH